MSRFAIISAAAFLLALASLGLPSSWQPLTILALFTGYSLLCVYAVTAWRSSLFGKALTAIPEGHNQVALTFDDGPDPETTPAILDLLAARGQKATFFVIGKRVRDYPELVARCRREGHSVGNHSDAHSLATNFLFHATMHRDLAACQAAIRAATGSQAVLYRPPFGLRNHAVSGVCKALDLELVGWNVRALDKPQGSADAIVARVLNAVKDGSVILLHDGGVPRDGIIKVLEEILDGLEQRGLNSIALPCMPETSDP